MFPEAFVEEWIGCLTAPGDAVIDPFAGRGTAPFQALLMGRDAIAADTNPVAYCVTRAKLQAPKSTAVARRLTKLERDYASADMSNQVAALPEFFRVAFHERTLSEILFLRQSLRWRKSRVDCMIAALVLGSLHGESSSPSYLSNQMPRTISTKPAYSMRWWAQRNLQPPERATFRVLRSRQAFRYRSDPPDVVGRIYNCDVRELPKRTRARAHLAITSPPYMDVTSYEEDQWLRLWFLGGPAHPSKNRFSPDDRHSSCGPYRSFLEDTWSALSRLLHPHANVVIRLGARRSEPEQLVDLIRETSSSAGRNAQLVRHEVSVIANRQTGSFRPGARGCPFEVDMHFRLDTG